jgi:ATP-dependent DNA helicase RecG
MIDQQRLERILREGEGIRVEFKTVDSELSGNVFETVAAFLNRNGGHLLLGVNDDDTVSGIDQDALPEMRERFASLCNNPQKLFPTYFLLPEEMEIDGRAILHVHVPESSLVHSVKGRVFDRNEDGDFDITGNQTLVSQLYLRKHGLFTENRIFPALSLSDFRTDLIARGRKLAGLQRPGHPWTEMDDMELMRHSSLYLKDYATGNEGFTLGAVLLLGKDEVIRAVAPHYRIDAIVRVQDTDRYDDRDDIRTNLIEAYDMLMSFIRKHLPDRFHLDAGGQRISLRDRIFREIVGNLIVHREYSNAFPARLIIEGDLVRTENWNRPHGVGNIDPATFSPFPKNPNITRFFKELGRVEELGSGVRNSYRLCRMYASGRDPQFKEGDTFATFIPIDGVVGLTEGLVEEMEVTVSGGGLSGGVSGGLSGGVNVETPDDTGLEEDRVSDRLTDEVTRKPVSEEEMDAVRAVIGATFTRTTDEMRARLSATLILVLEAEGIRIPEITEALDVSRRTAERLVSHLRSAGLIQFKGGSGRTGGYAVTRKLKRNLNSK